MVTDFSKPHYVALLLAINKQPNGRVNSKCDLLLHRTYYARLKKQNPVLFYGDTLNDTGLLIVLAVESDQHLARIVDNDPLLKTDVLEISSLTPFLPSL